LAQNFFENRNQHSVKNRFFSLISSYTHVPIRKIKTEIEYLNKFLIKEALKYHQNLGNGEKKAKIKEENQLSEFVEEENELSEFVDLSNEEFLNYISTPDEDIFRWCNFYQKPVAH